MGISPSANWTEQAAVAIYHPRHTVRCDGHAVFRSQLARDIACLMDIDDDVVAWSCQSTVLEFCDQAYRPDFTVIRADLTILVDAFPFQVDHCPPEWVTAAAKSAGFQYEAIKRSTLPAIRLKNAKDLLRYAKFEASLSDRIRLLAALDDQGSLTVAECLSAFQSHPIPSLASLLLHRFISIDLDEQLIGPESQVRRCRD